MGGHTEHLPPHSPEYRVGIVTKIKLRTANPNSPGVKKKGEVRVSCLVENAKVKRHLGIHERKIEGDGIGGGLTEQRKDTLGEDIYIPISGEEQVVTPKFKKEKLSP